MTDAIAGAVASGSSASPDEQRVRDVLRIRILDLIKDVSAKLLHMAQRVAAIEKKLDELVYLMNGDAEYTFQKRRALPPIESFLGSPRDPDQELFC
ncbi:Rx N-terminal domain-containing protein [Plasmodiophora brassicae]